MADLRVAVLGAGLMGSAIARHLVTQSAHVVVWNRSPEKSEPLSVLGIGIAESPVDALADSDVVIVILSDYSAGRSLLEAYSSLLDGRDVINMMTGSPNEAREFASFVEDAGARYLDGAIEAYPDDIGNSNALINFSGSADVWARHESLLTSIAGMSRFVGAQPGSANVLDAAMAGAFLNVSLGAFLEAAAYAGANDVSVDEISQSIDYWTDLLKSTLAEAIDALRSADFSTDQATLSVYLAAVRTWRAAMLESGTPSNLMTANMHNLEIAEASGAGELGICAQIDTMRRTR